MREQILDAARHMLRHIPPEVVDKALQDMESDGAVPGLKGGQTNAVRALLANGAGDDAELYRVGAGLLLSVEQSRRASSPRGDSRLVQLIKQHLSVDELVTPLTLWQDFRDQAQDGFHQILSDFDEYRELLHYEKTPGVIVSIGYDAFRRKVQRARASLQGQG